MQPYILWETIIVYWDKDIVGQNPCANEIDVSKDKRQYRRYHVWDVTCECTSKWDCTIKANENMIKEVICNMTKNPQVGTLVVSMSVSFDTKHNIGTNKA